ncbi:ATP-dependent DNA ligase [Cupriavidus sp. M-11]|uniref:ATP-dependent DNA ligase n=1 Tax=Cupriavidus sp. M-11 TaxID=3233038 RepID=UPI003F9263E8
MVRIRVATSPDTKVGRLPTGLSSRDKATTRVTFRAEPCRPKRQPPPSLTSRTCCSPTGRRSRPPASGTGKSSTTATGCWPPPGSPALQTRGGADATRWFPEIAEALGKLPPGNIVDGEVGALNDLGISDFDRLHRRVARRGWHEGAHLVAYCIFDLLVAGDRDFRTQPIEKRKVALHRLLGKSPPAGLLYVAAVDGWGMAL